MDGTQTYIDQCAGTAARAEPAGKRIYLALPVTYRDTVVERTVTRELGETYGWTVVTPHLEEHQIAYRREGKEFANALVWSCDALAYLPFNDGMIGSGAADAIKAARGAGLPVMRLEYDRDGDVLTPEWIVDGPNKCLVLSAEETYDRIAEFQSEKALAEDDRYVAGRLSILREIAVGYLRDRADGDWLNASWIRAAAGRPRGCPEMLAALDALARQGVIAFLTPDFEAGDPRRLDDDVRLLGRAATGRAS